MKKRIGIILLSAIILVSGCKTNSAGAGVELLMNTSEAESVPEALPERQSSEVCPENAEGSEETTGGSAETKDNSAETAAVSPETAESSPETAQPLPETETSTKPIAEPVAQTARDGYLTEVTHFSGTLTGWDSADSRLEVEIDIPFGKQCVIDRNGRVTIPKDGWQEDDTIYAFFSHYERYTKEILEEMLGVHRDGEFFEETITTREQTDSGEEFLPGDKSFLL